MKKLFDKITWTVGILFFGGWALGNVFFFCKALYDFIIKLLN